VALPNFFILTAKASVGIFQSMLYSSITPFSFFILSNLHNETGERIQQLQAMIWTGERTTGTMIRDSDKIA
jgi:hypothetical protein